MNIALLLDMVAQAIPDRAAVTCDGRTWTYAQLWERAGWLAAELTAQRSGPVTAACYLGVNSPEAVALLFGASRAGTAYAPLNYRWTADQLAEGLSRITPVSLLADDSCRDRVPELSGVTSLAADHPSTDADGSTGSDLAGDGDDAAVLLFTSGTSGPPKAAVLRNRHLVPYVLDTVEFLGADADEAILVSVPPYHIAAVSSVLTSVYAGRRMVQLTQFDPEEWCRTARSERVTQAMVVPTMLGRILDRLEADGQGLPHLRHLSYGGGRMPAAVIDRALRLLPDVDLVNAYGLTETSSTITLLSPQDHRDAAASDDLMVRGRLGSVGRALPSVEIEIRDTTGTVVPVGQEGEIWVRGDQVSGEYLSHRTTADDGWFPTRDHGHLDVDGFLYLHGRADDVIVRGGENLSPAEIEDRLAEHPRVAEAAVIGVPDTEWGERVEAFVVPRDGVEPDQDVLREWVRSALRSTRVPARIHVVTELPYNETGKLLRRELRARLTEPKGT